MSSFHHYSHRPPIPTVEEILLDFNSLKNSEEIDPVLTISDTEFETVETLEIGKIYNTLSVTNLSIFEF